MSETISTRREILFLYEAKDCNPNGDPLDENRPRTDPETGQVTVTDVRIKRTVRDYLYQRYGQEPGMDILIRDTFEKDGTLKDGKGRSEDFIGKEGKGKLPQLIAAVTQQVRERCIDARLFGSTLPVQKGSIKITGPVQFSAFNRSLHPVNPVFVQQTAAFAGQKGSLQKSFAERWLLPYAIICAYGVVNEVAAETTHLSEGDLRRLLEGLWHGTNNLNTHSKMGHQSMLLVHLEYEPGFRIGGLPERIRLETELEPTAIRKAADYRIDVAGLLDAMAGAGKRLKSVEVLQDDRLQVCAGDQAAPFLDLAQQRGLPVRTLDV